ncbi:MAG: sensor histidine kinase [Acidobacteria bacterium]|nr:MAG: sensor histidine kinase [Acidobacteriota bacterium]PYV71771.1 MAG: sensor histidine kinase [Acidobacteriota bacterium]
MHPILSHFRRLLLYLAAWGPISAILIYLFVSVGGLTWGRSAAMALPLCAVYAFMCLSAWYTCRGIPLENSASWLGHLVAAGVASLLWIGSARVLAFALSSFQTFAGLDQQIARAYPILFGSGVLLYLLAVALYYLLLSNQAAREAEKREVEARVLARESELKALKTQVNPHFIFNCLNSISALTSSDPAKAREMCILLGEFLRKTLGLGEKALIPLRDELALLHAYLSVEQIRFGSRLKLEESTDSESLDCLLPPLLLQPLVENAVRHGVAQLTEGGKIRIDIRQPEPETLAIAIENNFDPEAPRRRGAGIGLRNVRQRLDASYGNRAKLDVRANHDHFMVSLSLPTEKES